MNFKALFDKIKASTSERPPIDRNSGGSTIQRHLQEYLQFEAQSEHETPLQFWKQKVAQYPELRKIALSLLAVPASSGASERMFSIAAWLCADRKNRLDGEHLRNQVFMTCNKKIFRAFVRNLF